MKATKIEWTDSTWNPVVGCTIVSPGCANCYAMRQAARIERLNPELARYRGLTGPSNAGPVWNGTVKVAPDDVLTAPLRWKKPRRVFVNSMSDLFHEGVPDQVIDRVFAVMAMTPRHTYQVLTKRAQRMRDYWLGEHSYRDVNPLEDRVYRIADAAGRLVEDGDSAHDCVLNLEWPLPNVWLGVSTERQREADERIPLLLATPAAKRFISAEPLLGPLDLDGLRHRLDWIIAGGESGPGARPAHPDWFRGLRDQCSGAGVPFFFKQWGSWAVVHDCEHDDPGGGRAAEVERTTRNGGRWLNLAGGHGFHGERVVRAVRTDKHAAGAELDGCEHREWPT